MDKFTQIVNSINDFVWGPVMLLFLRNRYLFNNKIKIYTLEESRFFT